jgi:hypothetical protein
MSYIAWLVPITTIRYCNDNEEMDGGNKVEGYRRLGSLLDWFGFKLEPIPNAGVNSDFLNK